MIKIKSVVTVLLMICFFLESGVFNIPFLSRFEINSLYTITAITMALFLWCRFSKKLSVRITPYCKYIDVFYLLILFFLIAEVFHSYKGGWFDRKSIFAAVLYYLYLLLFYPIVYLLDCNGEKKVSSIIYKTAGMMMFFFGITAFIYNMWGINLCPNIINVDRFRNYGIRIRTFPLFWFIVLLAYTECLCSVHISRKLKYLFITIISVCYIIMVNQSRAQDIAVISMVVGMFLLNRRSGKKQLTIGILCLALGWFYFNSDYFAEFILSFSTKTQDNTTEVRIMFIEEFVEILANIKNGWLLGFGLPSSVNIRGQVRWFMDLGLLGDYFNTGFMAILLFFGMVFRLLVNIRRSYQIDRRSYLFSIGACIMLVFGIPGFTLQPASRIMAIPVLLAYTEYLANKKNVDDEGGV